MQVNLAQKNNLLKIIKKDKKYSYNSYLMEKLIKENHINFLIDKIDNESVKLPSATIEKKEQFSSEEQFESVLNKFIYYFKDYFIMKNILSDFSIKNILNINNPNLDFLFSKIYVYDNDYISYYKNEFNKAITCSFICNLQKFQYCSHTIEEFIKKYNLNIDDTTTEKDIENVLNILRKIVICNYNEINIHLLFLNYKYYFNDSGKVSFNRQHASFYFFISIYEIFIDKFYKKEKAINELIQF